MKRRLSILATALALLAGGLSPVWSAPPPSTPGNRVRSAPEGSQEQLEKLASDLAQERVEIKQLQSEISALEEKTAALRKSAGNEPGLLDEMRLKMLLNDLRSKLERISSLQRHVKETSPQLGSMALRLLSRINDQIDSQLKPAESPAALQAQIQKLRDLAQKRAKLKDILRDNPESSNPEGSSNLANLEQIGPKDKEGLQLALELLSDRKKDLGDRLEKLRFQEQEARGEMKLQRKMRDFLEGIQRMNDASDFPHSSLKRSDLGDTGDKSQDEKLQSRLSQIQEELARGEKNLREVQDLMAKIAGQIQTNDREKGGAR